MPKTQLLKSPFVEEFETVERALKERGWTRIDEYYSQGVQTASYKKTVNGKRFMLHIALE